MNKLSREQIEAWTEQLQAYFQEEGLEEIGNFQAEHLLHFVLKQVSPHIYNTAIQDARHLVTDRMQAIEDELYTLEKPAR